MPKPMSMTIEVEELAFGRVFRTLDGMPGVIAIKIAGSGPKGKAALPPNPNVVHPTSAQIVLAALANGPHTKGQLESAMVDGGKKVTSLPDTLYKLRSQKLVTGGAAKGYKITKAGQKAAATEEK